MGPVPGALSIVDLLEQREFRDRRGAVPGGALSCWLNGRTSRNSGALQSLGTAWSVARPPARACAGSIGQPIARCASRIAVSNQQIETYVCTSVRPFSGARIVRTSLAAEDSPSALRSWPASECRLRHRCTRCAGGYPDSDWVSEIGSGPSSLSPAVRKWGNHGAGHWR